MPSRPPGISILLVPGSPRPVLQGTGHMNRRSLPFACRMHAERLSIQNVMEGKEPLLFVFRERCAIDTITAFIRHMLCSPAFCIFLSNAN